MKDKILIDSSAWILSFRKKGNASLKHKVLESLTELSAVTTNIIILELLQGCRNEREFSNLQSRLQALELLTVNDGVWERAYHAGYKLRKKGITIPTVDIIIAALAKENNCKLLHHDRHFRLVSKHMGIDAIDFLD